MHQVMAMRVLRAAVWATGLGGYLRGLTRRAPAHVSLRGVDIRGLGFTGGNSMTHQLAPSRGRMRLATRMVVTEPRNLMVEDHGPPGPGTLAADSRTAKFVPRAGSIHNSIDIVYLLNAARRESR